MEFNKGQMVVGNDGKQREILDVVEDYRGKGAAIQFTEVRDGKWFGPTRWTTITKLPKWAK